MSNSDYRRTYSFLHIIIFFLIFLAESLPSKGQSTMVRNIPEALISFLVKDVDSGAIIQAQNAEILMIPASTLKIITTATALNVLGKEFQYTTSVYLQGEIHHETLYGDLIVIGGGDPTFGSSFFAKNPPEIVLQTIKEKLYNAGIRQVNGKIIIDQSIIPDPKYPAGMLWEDMGNYYAAVPTGLTWRDNTFEITLSSPPVSGQLCNIVGTNAIIDGVEFVNYVYSANNRKDSAYIYGYPGMLKWEIRGTIPLGRSQFTIKGANPDPALQFATELAQIIAPGSKTEIVVTKGDERIYLSDSISRLVDFKSPSLSEIVGVINQKSHNLLADHLFFSLNNRLYTTGDWWTGSARSVIDFWKTQGLTGPVRIRDGSGLSPKNLISAKYLVDIITRTSQGLNGDIFESSLAVGGKTGTLARMWQKTEWTGRVLAKSGSMEGVLCYAGIIKTKGNRKLAFCFMVNNFTCPMADIRTLIEWEVGRLIDVY